MRQQVPSDADQVREMTLAALGAAYGSGPPEVALIEGLRKDPAFDREMVLVALLGDLVVGQVMLTSVIIRGEARRWPAVCVAPLGVRIGHPRQGIGSALLRAGLDAARRKGYTLAVLEGSPDYYGRFGSSDAVPRGLMDSPGGRVSHFMVAELLPGALQEVTGKVEYSPYFAVVARQEPPTGEGQNGRQ